jgi:hypothetical protein
MHDGSRALREQIEELVRDRFPVHPCARLERPGLKRLMQRYLAVAQVFPHMQAGAQQRIVFHSMKRDEPAPEDVEITFVVASFLFWDELGGWERTREGGSAALPPRLEARAGSRSRKLRADIRRLFGEDLRPVFDPLTRRYLRSLYDGLSILDPVVRCAWMVSLERHAAVMIQALWDAVAALLEVPRAELGYFSAYLGDGDADGGPRAAMIARVIDRLVPPADEGRFLQLFALSYAAHHAFCERLAEGQEEEPRPDRGAQAPSASGKSAAPKRSTAARRARKRR